MTRDAGAGETGARCPECGWHSSQPAWRRIRWWSPLRTVPLLAAGLLIAWGLRASAWEQFTARQNAGFPEICQPPVTRAEVEAVAAGTATPEVVATFRRAVEALCAAPRGFGTMPEQPRELQVGFVAPPAFQRTDFRGGLFTTWLWWARTTPAEDAVHALPSRERPPLALPGRGARVAWSSAAWAFWITDGPGVWTIDAVEVRFDLRNQRASELSATLNVANSGDVALAAIVAGVVCNRLLARWRPAWRWKRRALATAAGVSVVAAAFTGAALLGGIHAISTRGWAEGTGGGWADLRASGWSAEEVREAAGDPQRTAALARDILARAPVEGGDGATYLAGVASSAAPVAVTWWRTGERFTVADYTRSESLAVHDGPLPHGLGGWLVACSHGSPRIIWRSDDGRVATRLAINPGPCCWLLAAGVVAWCAPGAFVGALRARRARRRMARGRCPRCAYQLDQAGGTVVST